MMLTQQLVTAATPEETSPASKSNDIKTCSPPTYPLTFWPEIHGACGLQPWTRYQLIICITDRSTKRTPGILSWKTPATHLGSFFLGHWMVQYRFRTFFLIHNGLQFVSELFETFCMLYQSKHITNTAYHPQANDEAEHYNNTTIGHLRHHVSDLQRHWDLFEHPLTYVYYAQVLRTTGWSIWLRFFS